MVFSLVRCLTGLKKPSQDNAEYINSGIVSWPSLITSGATPARHYDELDIRNIIQSSGLCSIAPQGPITTAESRSLRVRSVNRKTEVPFRRALRRCITAF